MRSTLARSRASSAGRRSESFETGLRKTVEWYLDNRAWWERIRSGVYRGERLGSRRVILVFGGSGQLGQELVALAQQREIAAASALDRARGRYRRSAQRRARRDRAAQPVAGRQRRRLHRGGQGRDRDRERAYRVNAIGAGDRRRRPARGAAPADPPLDRLRLRRHEDRPLRRGRSDRAARRLWAHEGRRRGAVREPHAASCDPAHLVGLRPVRPQFPQDHAAARGRARRAARSSPTSAAARLRRRPRARRSSPSRRGCAPASTCGAPTTSPAPARRPGRGFASRIVAAQAAAHRPPPARAPITTAEYPTPARRPANSRARLRAVRAHLRLPRAALGRASRRDHVGALVTAPIGQRCMAKGIILAGGAGTRLHPLTLVDLEAAAAGLRQADDLLSADDADAGGHPRDPDHHDAAGPGRVQAPARATASNGACGSTMRCSRARMAWRRPSSSARISCAGIPSCLVLGDKSSTATACRKSCAGRASAPTARRSSATRSTIRSGTAWSTFDDRGQALLDRGEAEGAEVALGGDRALFL